MRGIVRMSEELDAEIVCEGVETRDDLELMKQIEAYVAQGYYYSKPQPQAEFEKNLDAQYPV
jgi:EAL domain-containing protein (putative c-di-GMP-specific phosphodiesterase class I)